jgi:hypothetical protein
LADRPIRELSDEPGTFQLLRGQRESLAWAAEVFQHRLSHGGDGPFPPPRPDMPLEALADAVLLAGRRRSLDDLEAVVHHPHSSEHDLQTALEDNLWIFGGGFLPGLGKRRLAQGIELDLTLLRPDGSVHVVELKGHRYRSSPIRESGPSPRTRSTGRSHR